MNMLEALALVKDDETVARPLSWRGTARGITWKEARDANGKIRWTLGWREIGVSIPCGLSEKEYRERARVSLPSPAELGEEWEIIDRTVIMDEYESKLSGGG